MIGAQPTSFLMEQNHKLSSESKKAIAISSQYRRLVGRLIYLTITHPDITYAINILSQFMYDPRQGHWDAAMRVPHYLKSSPGQSILLPAQNNLQIFVYCDSNWATCWMSRQSTTGYLVKLGDALVSWKTKRQETVSRSLVEAEYRYGQRY